MLLGLAYPHLPYPGPSLLCCPGERQGKLSLVLQQVRGRASSSACHCWQGVSGGNHLSLAHVSTKQTSCGASAPHIYILGAASSHLSHSGELYCAAQVRGRASSRDLPLSASLLSATYALTCDTAATPAGLLWAGSEHISC